MLTPLPSIATFPSTSLTNPPPIGRLIFETVILLSARTQNDGGKVLRAAALAYKVDTDAIALKVKQEFAAKAKTIGDKKTPALNLGSGKKQVA